MLTEPGAARSGAVIGRPLRRKEDERLVVGAGRFLDDIALPKMVYQAILHSPHPHARIKSIDTRAALAARGVRAVITGKDLEAAGLAYIPTFHGFDRQTVLALDKVLFQYQEVAAVIADSREAAVDALELIEVEYEPLPAVVDPFDAKLDRTIVREDRENKTNHIYHWETGAREDVERALAGSHARIAQRLVFQRIHPAPLEVCGAIADMDRVTGRLTLYLTSQVPHAHRSIVAELTHLSEERIRVVSPDIGGAFGNKVPFYPGYVVALAASILLGVPVKWIETRTENLTTTGFARDYHIDVELGATRDGRVTALKVSTTADHGAFDAPADPTKFPAGMFGIVTGSYNIPCAFAELDAYYTNKAAGGVGYRCSFRVAEASYAIERGMDVLARELHVDPAELRLRNFVRHDEFPYASPLGFVYDSGDYAATLQKALDAVDYSGFRAEQAAKRARGELVGIGISTFTEVVGAGPSRFFDMRGLQMLDSAEIRVHPTGSCVVRTGSRQQGQGHETTWAQIVSEELGIDTDRILVEEGDTDSAPFGLGTFASRSTAVAGAALTLAARRIREKARTIAAHLLEAHPADVEWSQRSFRVRGIPARVVGMKDVARAAYMHPPGGVEPGLEAVHYYDPPSMTFPHGAYVAIVEVDRETGDVRVRRFVAVDDCGVVINPAIVEGQIHGGLTEGYAIAFMQEVTYDRSGINRTTNFTDYLFPTAAETPAWETHRTETPSPHHPLGAKGVGENPTVGSPAAFVNAVMDALAPLGIRSLDMPLTREKIWRAVRDSR